MFKKVVQGIKNLWYWLPVIWSDQQWDHWFLIKILEHKLRAMENHFGDFDYRYRSLRSKGAEIQYCRMLCTRIIQNNYLENVLRFHEQRWGVAELVLEDLPDGGCIYKGSRVPGMSDKDHEREKNMRGRLYDRARRQEDQDWSELFRLMPKYIRGWWD